jgi:hypothetical protein
MSRSIRKEEKSPFAPVEACSQFVKKENETFLKNVVEDVQTLAQTVMVLDHVINDPTATIVSGVHSMKVSLLSKEMETIFEAKKNKLQQIREILEQ